MRGRGNDAGNDDERKKEGLYSRLRSRLSRTREGFVGRVRGLLSRWRTIDEGLFEELEEILIQADVGVETTLEIVELLRTRVREEAVREPAELEDMLREIITDMLDQGDHDIVDTAEGLGIIMVVGVNGSGKTTTIAKLAERYSREGKDVLLAAADTFRAGAIEQIAIWGERLAIPVIQGETGSDPGAVVYDALQAAKARDADYLIVDTAGRLHTQKNLMEELKKIRRIIERERDGAPLEVLLVMDATVGQNGISQARFFNEAIRVTGIALTKLDGTARGGVVVAVSREFQLPVKLIGIGEEAEDLRDFRPEEFVEALFDQPGEGEGS